FIIRPDALDLTLPQETINDAKADGVTMLTDAMRETLQAYPVGGICQFGKNITDPEQLAQFNADLQAASRTPLFIAVDEEGGAVARLANHPAFDLPQYESAAAVGASGDPADACAMGQTIGAYLKEYGFNMDFAPDADVNTNPDNPIIGTRAFSSDAATAAEMAAAAADGLRTSGILPTLKHFPGHGDTAEDSHTALAVTYKTLDELQACELLPFAADTGLHAVMVGHIAAPNVTGDDTPATLSPQLVALIPDAENTLIVTDSLAMDAITAAYTPGEAAVQALQAGCDVLLMPNSLPEAYAAVLEAVQNGTISEERLDRSVNKILLYKQQFAS
ncbi:MULTISPECIES: glycoside hydrolase family 3 N-terminal domain-containing protein, partial [Gemmiger]